MSNRRKSLVLLLFNDLDYKSNGRIIIDKFK